MVFRAIGLLAAVLYLAACSDNNDQKACSPVDPVQVELGGIQYSIPASYQPQFSHNGGHTSERAQSFYLFTQSHYKDGKRLKYRYCKRGGHQNIDGVSFYLESRNSRHNDGYDTRDAIVNAKTPRFDMLERVSLISIRNVPSSTEPNETEPFYRGATLSDDGSYHFKNRPETAEGVCQADLVSTKPTIFGGKIRASCLVSSVKPHEATWRLDVSADGLGKPYGRLTIDIEGKPFEEWDPVLQNVKDFIDSMQTKMQ